MVEIISSELVNAVLCFRVPQNMEKEEYHENPKFNEVAIGLSGKVSRIYQEVDTVI